MRCAQIQRHGAVLLLVLELATATRLQGDETCAAARRPHAPRHSEATPLPPQYCTAIMLGAKTVTVEPKHGHFQKASSQEEQKEGGR